MNHNKQPTAAIYVFGKIMFVHALQSMKAGDEITIVYHTNPTNLKLVWNIIE